MHFFIDHTQLSDQTLSDVKFGPNSNNPEMLFDVSTQFQLTAERKAFACNNGFILVQQSSVDPSLVNIILKPEKDLKISFGQIKYFVYRGLLKNSFIDGTNIVEQENANNSAFIARFWTVWNKYKMSTNKPALPNPGHQSLGYDNDLSGSLDIEKVFDTLQSEYGQPKVSAEEGEWIGNFGTSSPISFEVVIEANNIFNLDFLRAGKYQIDVTGLSGLELKVKREQILSFIDPAAFFGLHYDEGVNVSTYNGNTKTTEKKKQTDLYNSLISKFANKNCVYLDIRSEKGYSYNFYQNYGNADGKNIKIGNSTLSPIEETYVWDSWPLIMIDSALATTENKNNIKINLRIDDNTKPVLFCENTTVLANNYSSNFINEKDILNGTAVDWSKDLDFVFPNAGTGANKDNVACYIQLYYYRQEYNPASPDTVLKNETYFDSAFCPIDLPNLGDTDYRFCHLYSCNNNFIRGTIPSTDDFSYVSNNHGCYWDSLRVLFFTKATFSHRTTRHFFPPFETKKSNTGFNLEYNPKEIPFLAKNIQLTQKKIQENIGSGNYQQIKLLDITNSNEIPNSRESVLCLGITQAELSILKNLSGFSNLHYRYIYIEEVINSPFTDKDNKPFQKYKLSVQGLDDNGDRLIISPIVDIYVYSDSGIIFASKDFAGQEINQQGLTYVRNYEENTGYVNKEKTTGKRYEDYFIDKNLNMKNKVNNFITELNNIADNTPNTYSNIESLVENNAQDIWNEAVNSVKANNNANPDDRPLYWTRNKMEATLKEHPYFEGQFAGSEVLVRSDLDTIIKLFEEKSRNYTGVDFSGVSSGAKKILITGFDPFGLNKNIEQSNPSGVCALALHGEILGNGYIQTMIVPVRYTDFDGSKNSIRGQGEGIIEKFIKPWLNEVDMIITISQAAPNQYHIDVFATATRGGSEDNMNYTRKLNRKSINSGSETIKTTLVTDLPNAFIQPPVELYGVYYTAQYQYDAAENFPNNFPTPTTIVYYGPGGDYLSNEIFYRVARLREQIRPTLPTGHFHIAQLQDKANGKPDFSPSETKDLLDIVKQAITRGVNAL